VYTIRLFSLFPYVEVCDDTSSPAEVFARADLTRLNTRLKVDMPAGAVRVEGGFVIQRYLLEYERLRPVAIHAVIERLAETGHYERVVLKSLPYSDVEHLVRRPSAPLPR
jgi:hypothetical protein